MTVISLPQGDDRPLTERVAEEVRALMGRYGVTQMQLVEVLHVSQTGVSKRLRGLIPFDINELGLLADYFGVDPGDLLGAPKSPRPKPDGGSREAVRHQGLEPRTRWLTVFPPSGELAEVISLADFRRSA